jgi:hypothetical protein
MAPTPRVDDRSGRVIEDHQPVVTILHTLTWNYEHTR